MNIPLFLFGLLFLFLAGLNLRTYWSFKKGRMEKEGVVKKIIWKQAPRVKFQFLYDKESPVITYQFPLQGAQYEKTEDAFMEFTKGVHREGSKINIYIPKSNNPEKVTIINPFKFRISLVVFLSLASVFFIVIAFVAK